MKLKEKTHFKLDKSKCTKCGKCINVCSGMVLEKDESGYPEMKEFERFGWRGCWKCEHCLAVCPNGAISIFNHDPNDSLLPPNERTCLELEKLMVNRRSCRRYLDKDVDSKIIDRIIKCLESAPTGGNSSNVEYTIIDDSKRVKEIWEIAYNRMEELAHKHIYTSSFSDFYYRIMKKSEKSIRKNDMLFCGAPHLFIAHEKCVGKWGEDSKANCNIATAYFELLANAYGLGTIIMSYPSEVIEELVPIVKDMLGIPKDHYMKLIVGFGYPEIKYSRGVQRERTKKVHRYSKTH
jgi:nitroreductase/Pyruvate/2-oxoacid:ferredoxin oxidoreductase delta subunit